MRRKYFKNHSIGPWSCVSCGGTQNNVRVNRPKSCRLIALRNRSAARPGPRWSNWSKWIGWRTASRSVLLKKFSQCKNRKRTFFAKKHAFIEKVPWSKNFDAGATSSRHMTAGWLLVWNKKPPLSISPTETEDNKKLNRASWPRLT
jgi:hypothetical protein